MISATGRLGIGRCRSPATGRVGLVGRPMMTTSVSLACRLDPPAEVGSELCDGNVYEPDVDSSEPQFTQMARSGVGGYRVPWLSDW
jgi:hypothetical protein